jgi:hypothetical protein
MSTLAAALKVDFTPDLGIPGGHDVHQLTTELGTLILALSLAALLLSAGSWAMGTASGNLELAARGRVGVFMSTGIGMLIGAAPLIVNFTLQQVGNGLH